MTQNNKDVSSLAGLNELYNKTDEELLSIAESLDKLAKDERYNKLARMYPETGPYSKYNYPKHMEFMEASNNHNILALIGANGVGKSWVGATFCAYHLTGLYPEGWKGKRFDGPIKAWICGRENKIVKESIQEILFGDFDDKGSGVLPRHALVDDKDVIQTWAMAGTANCIGSCRVRHYTDGIFDGWSTVDFKTYAQGWQEFQGSTRQLIWMDEEPDDPKVYAECLARTRGPKGKEGMVICTFTPLLSWSTVYLSFVPGGQFPENGIHPTNPDIFVIRITWKDVPHLSESWKRSQIESWKLTDPGSIQARTEGIASCGAGRVFPIDESFVVVPPFKIPIYWKKCYGLDPGWNATACIWITKDPETNIYYVYSEYQAGQKIDSVHVEAIKARGSWIQGGIDPHGALHKRDDGTDKIDYFCSLGLEIIPAKGDSMTSISMIRGMFETGTLKIINTCPKLVEQIRTYRFDANHPEKIAKDQDDHEIDALKYAMNVFDLVATSFSDISEEQQKIREYQQKKASEQGRSWATGY